MAKRGAWRNRLLMLLAAGFFSLLIVADIMPNPFPALWDWLNRDRPIAADMHWQDRLGGRPSVALAADGTLAVDAGRTAEIVTWDSRRDSNRSVAQWTADWLTVAGTGSDAVVITGESMARGYEVRDPGSGSILFPVEGTRAVWGFQDMRMDLVCETLSSCALRAYRPREDVPLWTADLPGVDSSVVGVDPDLATAGVDVPARVHPRVSGTPRRPELLGIPIDRRRVAVVHSGTGEVLAKLEAASDELVMVVGDRVVRSVATRRDGVCILSVTGHDLVTDVPVWGPEPYNLRTITGGGCDQRYTAVAAGGALVVVDPEGNERVIDVGTGRVLWRGQPGERVQGLSPTMAVIRSEDEPTIRYAVRLGGGGEREWERSVEPDAELLFTECGVVVADRDPNRIYVWHPDTGNELLSVRTSARVMACTADGIVLSDGRAIGLAWFGGSVSGTTEEGVDPK
jgi:hypothetical protein